MYSNQYYNAKISCNHKSSHDLSPELSLPKSMRPIIPEPKHRVGPKGIVSSGISFRKLPEPSLKSIYNVCQHYESKCSGNYTSLASRYLSQMSSEVKGLVDSLENEQKENENYNGQSQQHGKPTISPLEKNKKIIKELKNEMNELQTLLSNAKDECKRTKQKAKQERDEYKAVCKQKVDSDRLYHESLLAKVKEESKAEVINAKKNVEKIKEKSQSTIRFLQKESRDKIQYCKSLEKIIQEQQIEEKELRDKFVKKFNEVGIYFLHDDCIVEQSERPHWNKKRHSRKLNHLQFKNQSVSNKVDTLRSLRGTLEQVTMNLKYKDLVLDDDDDSSTLDFIYE